MSAMDNKSKISVARRCFAALQSGAAEPEVVNSLAGKMKEFLADANVDERTLFGAGTEEFRDLTAAQKTVEATIRICHLRYARAEWAILQRMVYDETNTRFVFQSMQRSLAAAGVDECALFPLSTAEAQSLGAAKIAVARTINGGGLVLDAAGHERTLCD